MVYFIEVANTIKAVAGSPVSKENSMDTTQWVIIFGGFFIVILVPLIIGNANFRRAFLEFHRITTRLNRFIDKLFGNVHLPIVIDADFGNDIYGMAIANFSVSPDAYFSH